MITASVVVEFLHDIAVKDVYGLPGSPIIVLYHELLIDPRVNILTARSEVNAIFMASGVSRAAMKQNTMNTGVCLVTTGPGSALIINGVIDAYRDHVPMLVFVGAPISEVLPQYQGRVLQDIPPNDMFLTGKTCKYYSMIDTDNPYQFLKNMYKLAWEEPRGPIVIAGTDSMWRKEVTLDKGLTAGADPPDEYDVTLLLNVIKRSKRPILLLGRGGNSQWKRLNIPIVTTMPAVDMLSHDDNQMLGIVGIYGSYVANRVLPESDLIIGVGTSWNKYVTVNDQTFIPMLQEKGITTVTVDIDVGDNWFINNHVDYVYQGDAENILDALLDIYDYVVPDAWLSQIDLIRSNRLKVYDTPAINTVPTPYAIKRVGNMYLNKRRWILTGVGDHQVFTANYFPFRAGKDFFIDSSRYGSMGFGLGAAIGIARNHPDDMVILIDGDGSIQISLSDLISIRSYGITNILVCVIDNHGLGMVDSGLAVMEHDVLMLPLLHEKIPMWNALGAGAGLSVTCVTEEGQEISESTPGMIVFFVPTDQYYSPQLGTSYDDILLLESEEKYRSICEEVV